jgi:hypothetical protein
VLFVASGVGRARSERVGLWLRKRNRKRETFRKAYLLDLVELKSAKVWRNAHILWATKTALQRKNLQHIGLLCHSSCLSRRWWQSTAAGICIPPAEAPCSAQAVRGARPTVTPSSSYLSLGGGAAAFTLSA